MTEGSDKKPTPTFRKGLLTEVMQASTPTGVDAMRGGDLFKRKRVTFVMPAHICTAEFPEDFEVTLQETSAQQEMEAAAMAKGSEASLGFALAKLSVNGVNGEAINTINRDWLWEAIGSNGRALVTYVFGQHFGVGADDEGKAMLGKAMLGARIE